MAQGGRSRASEDLLDQERNSLDEARMVLPGIQAVFGFQLIAVFNERFAQLPEVLRIAHFASLSLVVVAVARRVRPPCRARRRDPALPRQHRDAADDGHGRVRMRDRDGDVRRRYDGDAKHDAGHRRIARRPRAVRDPLVRISAAARARGSG